MAETASTVSSRRQWSLPVRGGLAVVLSVAVNALVVTAATSLELAPGFRPLSLPSVAFLSAVGALGATVVYALLVRYVDRPARTFRRVAVVVLVLSFLPDAGLLVGDPEATVAGVAVLMLMHVVVAALSVELLVGLRGGEPA